MSMDAYLTEDHQLILSSIKPQTASSRCTLEYLNEGGANLIFRIRPAEDHTIPATVQDKLLRLRKDLPHLKATPSQHAAYEANFSTDTFQDYLIEHKLIRLSPDLPSTLNDLLAGLDRPSHRAADFLPINELHGLLVKDMTPGKNDILVELKPKWLAQSPSAPRNAKRCRTCALRAQRASRQIRTATDAQESCPLDLVSDEITDRQRAASKATSDEQIAEYLVHQAQPLLQALRSHQSLDEEGSLHTSSTDTQAVSNLCKAMTLRDCTLFLRRRASTIEARLGDVDLKQPEKLPKWQDVERSLIDGGWYADTDEPLYPPEHICRLSRGPKK